MGKNVNVFYEFGFFYVVNKLVVFMIGDLEDVFFDLWYLRVVVYDIRDFLWGEKLKFIFFVYLKVVKVEFGKLVL